MSGIGIMMKVPSAVVDLYEKYFDFETDLLFRITSAFAHAGELLSRELAKGNCFKRGKPWCPLHIESV
jgi:hypothetical protein